MSSVETTNATGAPASGPEALPVRGRSTERAGKTVPEGETAMSADQLICTHEADFPVGLVRATGTLSLATVAGLRRAGLKALTDHPELLLVDVSAMSAADDVTLTVFAMLSSQGVAAGTDVMIVGADAVLRRQLDRLGVTRLVPIHATAADARAQHTLRPGPVRLEVTLSPAPEATGEARGLVDRACARWRIGHLADTAALIVTELVANAVQHAGTPIRLGVTLGRRRLYISVRDGSPRPVRRTGADDEAESGRGLLIVEGLASAWGSTPMGAGKIVWATMTLSPVRHT
jgi:anti-anti-sigma regulatory factor